MFYTAFLSLTSHILYNLHANTLAGKDKENIDFIINFSLVLNTRIIIASSFSSSMTISLFAYLGYIDALNS